MRHLIAPLLCVMCVVIFVLAGIVGLLSGDYALTVIAGFFVIVMGTVARDEFRHAAKARNAMTQPPFTTEKG